MSDVYDVVGSYNAIHDFFQNNGVGDYKIQCDYGGVPYATDENIHAGDRFWSNDFTDSHFGREIKMYPQSELLAQANTGNTLPVLISLDDDSIKITEYHTETKSVKVEKKSDDLVYDEQNNVKHDKTKFSYYDNQEYTKCYKTRLSYDDVHVYNNDKVSTFSIGRDVPQNPSYNLDITFIKINDNQPGFWQKFKNMFS
ncbi:hypothetical protein [Wolbachia endosymbiont of Folsomia candida]|uniref:hypothetical protein n=1 Tax=Wolbachia endosymbiont of Folsomia candida TaxID=169402 RepID=UPI000ABDFC7F|nr:hypothetical protein [Wolbachia endosymbiont of Folsomia candida]APR97784.1 hypothetical protein ASM33_00280 [Wolbachia endosymbiont of Folsomia candida]